jgi:hypothetical protein
LLVLQQGQVKLVMGGIGCFGILQDQASNVKRPTDFFLDLRGVLAGVFGLLAF